MLPASGATVHESAHGPLDTSAERPAPHADAHAHGAGNAAPPTHQLPAGHGTPTADVPPLGQCAPGGAAHALHEDADASPVVAPNVAAGHGTTAPPGGQNTPRGHAAHERA